MHNPRDSGDFIRTEIPEPLKLSVAAAAKVLEVSRPTLSTLLNGHSDHPARWRRGSYGDDLPAFFQASAMSNAFCIRMQNSPEIGLRPVQRAG
jgi:hypothetical protein